MVGTCNSHGITIIIHNGLIETWRRVLRTPPLLSGGAPQVEEHMTRRAHLLPFRSKARRVIMRVGKEAGLSDQNYLWQVGSLNVTCS